MSLKWDEERKRRKSEKMKEYYIKHPETAKEHDEKMREYWASCSRKGRKWNEKEKKKHSEWRKRWHREHPGAAKEMMNRPGTKQKQSDSAIRRYLNPEERRRHSENQKKVMNRSEVKEAVSEGLRKYWMKIPHGKKLILTLPARMAVVFPSAPETGLYENIKRTFSREEIEHNQYIAGIECDIIFRKLKINIEYDGIYWHQNPEKDKTRDELLQKLGWIVLRVREAEEFDIGILHELVEEKYRGKETEFVLQGAAVSCP